ncbi:uncharacterized protein LOC135149424 [Daucus carota subsp. sativus]|uniref:uncharacterized protein LOC135149424 n=1 Tax=Daucus carota subsp. sativus TaxID=79200 RepID=UPI003082B9C6
MEAVADYELWIWHAYFGLPGSNNDINVLESSNLFANYASGGPSRFWNKHVLHDIMTACIIMHNMIIEDDRDVSGTFSDSTQASIPNVEMVEDENVRFQDFLSRHKQIKDKEAHIALRNALIDHLWEEYTNLEN